MSDSKNTKKKNANKLNLIPKPNTSRPVKIKEKKIQIIQIKQLNQLKIIKIKLMKMIQINQKIFNLKL